MKPIVIVQGAQWGSEAKGAVAAALCVDRQIEHAVRTGAVNAGHTVYWDGQPRKMQQLPTGWINPSTNLVIGAGAFIFPEILANEIALINSCMGGDVRNRLFIDYRASLHLPDHQEQAKLENRHHAIGATGKGCSVAITDKIRYRGKGYKLFHQWNNENHFLKGLNFCDTQDLLHKAYDKDQQILLEGTQGSLLDLHLGPYPYTTHKQTGAAQWVMEAGLSPSMSYETVLVARTHPIRVAGNSGPMPHETTWPNLAREINRKLLYKRLPQRVKSYALVDFEASLADTAQSGKYKLPTYLDGSANFDMHKWSAEQRVTYAVALSELHATALQRLSGPVMKELTNLFELTTVTKKLRRIASWDSSTVSDQCLYQRADHVVLTFWNYWFPELWDFDRNDRDLIWNSPEYRNKLVEIEASIQCPISMVSTGPESDNLIYTPWGTSLFKERTRSVSTNAAA